MAGGPLEPGALAGALGAQFGAAVSVCKDREGADLSVRVGEPSVLPALSQYLFWQAGCPFGGLIVEEREAWELRYLFLMPGAGWVHVLVTAPLAMPTVPSVSAQVHAADWHEREAEDLFGLHFEAHPRLGDFVLHDQVWPEALAPMRRAFDARQTHLPRRPREDWRPLLVVRDPGAFAMPVGPVYEGGLGEAVHFLLETVGEDVVRAVPRLFHKHRAVEKIVEGQSVSDALLLAERFAATSAFAHSLAFCQAVETIGGWEVPPRAGALRVALGELERLRHHAGTIAGICQSTALGVSEAHAAIVEEHLLRACAQVAGHRYLFGLNTPGGLRRDIDPEACRVALRAVDAAAGELRRLEDRLRYSSSFLDRLEEVGIVTPERARDLDLVGPVGRASGRPHDWRRACPYAAYGRYRFEVASEREGDGYARLRVLFFEAQQSAGLVRQALASLEPGPVCTGPGGLPAGAASGWVEAPIGAATHWIRLDDAGRIERYRILTPSFRNWLGFHVAVEDFAFQDFPIILASFGLSAAECDR